jgi:hypothetical protein
VCWLEIRTPAYVRSVNHLSGTYRADLGVVVALMR